MTQPSGRSSALLKILLGLSLVIMGSCFVWLLWRSYEKALETRRWQPTEAVVLSSQVLTDRPSLNSPLTYRADVRYQYTHEGVRHESRRIRRVDGSSNKADKAERQVEAYAAGKIVTCHVNPAQPDFAVLEHISKAGLYSIWFPLLFVIGGGGMIWSALRKRPAG